MPPGIAINHTHLYTRAQFEVLLRNTSHISSTRGPKVGPHVISRSPRNLNIGLFGEPKESGYPVA